MEQTEQGPRDNVEVKVPSILMDLIPQYLENRRNEIQVLNEALQKRDFQTIQSIGHKLKGNAGSYGFEFLTEIGSNLEVAGRTGEEGRIPPLIQSYNEYLHKIKIVAAK